MKCTQPNILTWQIKKEYNPLCHHYHTGCSNTPRLGYVVDFCKQQHPADMNMQKIQATILQY